MSSLQPRRLHRHLVAPLTIGASLVVFSCTASLDLERFKKAEQSINPGGDTGTPTQTDTGPVAPTNPYVDLRFSGVNMVSHLGEYFEIRLVNKANRLQSKAVYSGVTNADFSIFMQSFIPRDTQNAPYRIDFWADHNNPKGDKAPLYDGIAGGINDADHAWRRVLKADELPTDITFANSLYDFKFIHNTEFTDIFNDPSTGETISKDENGKPLLPETNLTCTLTVLGAAPYAGKMIEIRVIDKTSRHLVGLYRRGAAPESFTAEITGIVDEDTTYEVNAYADVNDDKKYSAGDPAWKTEISSTKELRAELNLAGLSQTPIDTGEPQ